MKLRPTLLAALALALAVSPARAEKPPYEIKPDVVYGHKMGMALTFDVIRPAKEKSNGAGVLFMVSGGWVSGWLYPEAALANKGFGFTALLDKGYTVFLVRHGSSPLFKVPECVADVRRAVRFIRQKAADWEIDPTRLGVYGMSAGGHLSLMLATTGDDGDPAAKDPVDQGSSRVAAVAALCPPSELKSYLESEPLRQQFPALQFDAGQWQSVSPIEHVTPDDAPALMFHGNKDELVPDSHSWTMRDALQAKGVATDLVIYPGAAHSFSAEDQVSIVRHLGEWFDHHLAKPAPAAPPLDLAGVWKTSATMPDGAVFPATFSFQQENGAWQGTADSRHGVQAVDRITIGPGTVRLEMDLDRDGQTMVLRIEAEADPQDAHQLKGTWSALRDGGSSAYTGAWEATRDPAAARPATSAILAGEWAVHLTFGNEEREYTLRFTADGGQVKGVAVIPDEPEHPIESVSLENQDFAMRIKKDFDGKETTLVFNGKLEERTLTGKVVIEGREAEYALDWTAIKKP